MAQRVGWRGRALWSKISPQLPHRAKALEMLPNFRNIGSKRHSRCWQLESADGSSRSWSLDPCKYLPETYCFYCSLQRPLRIHFVGEVRLLISDCTRMAVYAGSSWETTRVPFHLLRSSNFPFIVSLISFWNLIKSIYAVNSNEEDLCAVAQVCCCLPVNPYPVIHNPYLLVPVQPNNSFSSLGFQLYPERIFAEPPSCPLFHLRLKDFIPSLLH